MIPYKIINTTRFDAILDEMLHPYHTNCGYTKCHRYLSQTVKEETLRTFPICNCRDFT